MPSPEPRPALPADAERVAEIAAAAYGDYPERIGVRPRPLDDDYAELVERGVVWVTGPRRADAFVVLIEHPDHLWIDNVAVDPELRGRGIGRGLIAFAERRATSLGLAEARLLTHERMRENIALYRSLGYEPHVVEDGEPDELVRMRKPLGAPPDRG